MSYAVDFEGVKLYKEASVCIIKPYIDDYGEVNPRLANSLMHLDVKRYDYLKHLWTNNLLIDEINHKILSEDSHNRSYRY